MLELISATFTDLLQLLERTDARLIYLVLFSMAFLENIFPPLPGDTFTIAGGYLAATGKLNVVVTLSTVTAGTLGSVMFVYFIGYLYGRDYFVRKQFLIFNRHDVERVERWFAKFGSWTLLFSRFIVGGRVAIALGAGISRYPTAKMAVFSLVSAVIFHGLLVVFSFAAHSYIHELVDGFNLYSKIILVILTAFVIFWFVVVIRRIRDGRKKA